MEGIILHSIPFEDNHRIITFFCQEEGIIKVFVYNAGKQMAKFSYLKTLSKVNLTLTKGKKELYYLQEGQFIKSFIENPKNFREIQIAMALTSALLTATFTHQATKAVYFLFEAFLTANSYFKKPENLLRTFQIKMLIHEGVLNLSHLPKYPHFLEQEEKILSNMNELRHIAQIDDLEIPLPLGLKIETLFNELFFVDL